MTTYRIKVPTITCASCTDSLESVFNNELAGTISACRSSVNNKMLIVTVNDDIKWEKLAEIAGDCGHDVDVTQSYQDDHRVVTSDTDMVAHAPDSMKHYLLRAGIAGLIGLPQFIVCLMGMSIPLYGMIIMAAVTLPAMIYSGYKIFRRAYYEFKKTRSFTMDSLFTLSSFVSYITSVIGIAMPSTGMAMSFEAVLFILGFRNLGIAIETKVKEAVGKYHDFLDITPVNLSVKIRGAENKWCVDIEEGDVIIVEAGDTIPLDGEIIDGHASVCETLWSGDDHPRDKVVGQSVYAGMTVQTGRLAIRVTATREESLLARLDKQMLEAEASRPPLEALMTKVVKRFVPAVLLIAALSLIFVSAFVSPVTAAMTFISVLSVACPCVFGWLVPLAIQIAIRKAADHGAIFAKHQAMQTAAEIDTMIFDKTGTLTEPDITGVVGDNPEKIMAIAIALEEGSTHVIANAIRQFGVRRQLAQSYYGENLEDYLGLGRRAMIKGKSCLIGNERLLSQLQIDFSRYQAELTMLHNQGKSALFVVRNNEVLGYLVQEHQVKPGVKESLDQLRQRGIKNIKMCTGSDRASALAVAKQIGMRPQDVYAEQTPEMKAELVRKLQGNKSNRHVVGYVGDGGNDAPAMQAADVSYVMNSGDEICKNKADVILRDYSLQPLVNSITIAKQARTNIRLNLALTIGFNLVMISIAAGAFIPFGFTLTPAIAAAFMIGEALVVLLMVFIFRKMKVPGADHVPTKTPLVTEPVVDHDYEHQDGEELKSLLSQQPRNTRSPLDPGPAIIPNMTMNDSIENNPAMAAH